MSLVALTAGERVREEERKSVNETEHNLNNDMISSTRILVTSAVVVV